MEKLNKEFLELKDHVKYFSLNFQIKKKEENINNINQRGTLRTLASVNGNLVKIIRGGLSK